MSINATLIAQIVVFLILAWFTMSFVWPPITKALDERAKKIADGLSAADKAKAELTDANKRVEAQLAAARTDATQRLADAERLAQSMIEEAKGRASEEGAKIIASAKAEAEQEAIKVREALRDQVAAQVFDVVSSVVKTPLSDASKNLLRTVIENGRLSVLPEIAAQFHALINAQRGVSDALVESAFAISEAQLPDIIAVLEKRFGRK